MNEREGHTDIDFFTCLKRMELVDRFSQSSDLTLRRDAREKPTVDMPSISPRDMLAGRGPVELERAPPSNLRQAGKEKASTGDENVGVLAGEKTRWEP